MPAVSSRGQSAELVRSPPPRPLTAKPIPAAHDELLTPDQLGRVKGVPLAPYTPMLDLERRLLPRVRCEGKGGRVGEVDAAFFSRDYSRGMSAHR
jgi:hypothetical protein